MKRIVAALPLCLAAPVLAQPPLPAPPAPADGMNPPPLPPVPRETPENTGPLISPATPGVNLDAPPEETQGVLPVVPDAATAPEPFIPLDERDKILLEEGENVTARVLPDRRTILEGDVRVRYRGYRVRADRVTIDDKKREATFEGNVVIESGGQSVYGDSLRLDLRARRFQDFTFGGGRAVVPPERIGPNLLLPLRLSGRTLSRIGRDLVATEGFLTTCDFPDPHYRLSFRKATLLPNRRLALRDTTIYVGDRRLLRLPYLAIPLSERRFQYRYLPEVGRTEEEGFFVRTALGYALRETLPGILRLDLMQKKGVGLGVDQTYQFGAAAAGTFVLYALRDQNRGVNNLTGRLNHQQRLPLGITAAITSDFQQNSYQALSTNSKTALTNLLLTRAVAGFSTSLGLNFANSNYGFGGSSTRALTFSQTAPLGPAGNFSFRYNSSLFATPGTGTLPGTSREDSNADIQARTRLGVFDLDIAANKNLTGSQSGGGFFGGTERLPEITLGTDTSRFGRGWLRKLLLRVTTGYGRFIEGGTEPRETDRALFALDSNPAPIPLTSNLSLQLGGTYRQTVYGGNMAQYVLTGRSQLTQKLGGLSSLNVAYGYLRPYGFAPLRSDQSGSFNNANANLTVSGRRVRLTLFTGYDIQEARRNPLGSFPRPRNPWQNLSLQLGLRPSGVFQTRLTSSYDINTGRLRDLTNRVRVRVPGGLALDTGIRFDPATRKFPQINGSLETPLFGGAYNISAFAGYNGFTRRFEYRNFAVTRSWHDYELTVTYVDQPFGFRSEKGFNVMFRLKALPVFQRSGVGQFGTALDTGTGEVF